MLASALPASSPCSGVPRSSTRANHAGSTPSRAAASGSCADSRIQPLSAPKQEIAMTTASVTPAAGPQSERAASAIGACDCASTSRGRSPRTAQLPLAAARDGLFPASFTRLDKGGTPVVGVIVSSVLASALVAANYSRSLVQVFTFSILLSTAATLLPYVVSSAAWLVRGTGAVSRTLAALALAYSLYAMFGIGTEALVWGAVLILAGFPLYAWMRRRRVATSP